MNEFKVTVEVFADPAGLRPEGPLLVASACGNGLFPSLEWFAAFSEQAREGFIKEIEKFEDE